MTKKGCDVGEEVSKVEIETMEYNGIRFEVLRKYLSPFDRLSIYITETETLQYENFICKREVPDSYNDLYVYGIGAIVSEFYKDEICGYSATGDSDNLTFVFCVEIVLSKEPRTDI